LHRYHYFVLILNHYPVISIFSEKAGWINGAINQPYKVFENQKRQGPNFPALLLSDPQVAIDRVLPGQID